MPDSIQRRVLLARTPAEPFGATLSREMASRGVGVCALAREAGVRRQTISRMLNERVSDPYWTTACALVGALGMSLDGFRALQVSGAASESSCPDSPEDALAARIRALGPRARGELEACLSALEAEEGARALVETSP